MVLDELKDLEKPAKSKLSIFQNIAAFIEIGLGGLTMIGVLFKVASFPRASEILIIALTSLSVIYAILPILLFKSKKIGGHLLSHAAGLGLFVVLMGALFKIESWPYAQEMIISATFIFIPLVLLLIILSAINFKDKERINFYLRIGLRLLLVLILFAF